MSVLSIHFRLVFSAFLSLIIVSCEPTTDVVEEKNNAAALMSKLEAASAAYIKSRITNPERIYGKGYGESKLIVDCPCEGTVKSTCPEEEHQKNRRTEFVIMKM
jgi:hypothetical protein